MYSTHNRGPMFQTWTPEQRNYAHAARPGRLPAWIRLLSALGLVAFVCDILSSAISPLCWILAVPLAALALYYNGESVMTAMAEVPEPAVAPAPTAVPNGKTVALAQMRVWHREQLAELVGTCTQEQIGQVRTMLTRIERVWARLWAEHESLGFEHDRLAADVPPTRAQRETMRVLAERRDIIVARADRLERLGRTLPERIATLAGGYTRDAVREGLSLAMVEAQFGIDQLAA
ncbi:MAG: hypothetical protein JWN20_1969 [Jatrophihabitantaceae bacterium]|nr:hypothetical protein [Jatrophihabitantaceae bacterium]